MKKIFLLLIILVIYGCNKTKTVLICGDHVCINKEEAEQYFEDNLILEVRLIDNKKKKEIDLIELNLKSNSEGKKKISMLSKDKTTKSIRTLSNNEIKKKKNELKKRKKINKKKAKDKKIVKEKKIKTQEKQKSNQIITKTKKSENIIDEEITDICIILEKCNIKEISEFLVKQGKEKKFPDITIREN